MQYILRIICFCCAIMLSQGLYSKTLYTIKIPNTQFYTISFKTLSELGIDTTLSIYSQLKLKDFNQEISYTVLDSKVLFYGKTLGSELDSSLSARYGNSLSNVFLSQYSDTNHYVLELSPSSISRTIIADSYQSNLPVAEVSVLSHFNVKEYYQPGEILFDVASNSEITASEGWMSHTINLNQTRTVLLSTLGFNPNKPYTVQIKICGASNAIASGDPNHHLQLYWNQLLVKDTLFRGYDCELFGFTSNVIQGQHQLQVKVLNDLGISVDNQAIVYYTLKGIKNDLNDISPHVQYSIKESGTLESIHAFIAFDEQTHQYYRSQNIANLHSISIDVPTSALFLSPLDSQSEATVEMYSLVESTLEPTDYLIFYPNAYHTSAIAFQQHKSNLGKTVRLKAIEDVYQEYTNGIKHPLALRLCIEANQTLSKYIVLWGKGYAFTGANATFPFHKDIVPNMGVPSSDQLYIANLKNNTFFNEELSIGRIPIQNDAEGMYYVAKLIAFEASKDRFNTKRILQLTGGRTSSEQLVFNSLTNGFNQILQDSLLGAEVVNIQKSNTETVTSSFKKRIQSSYADGLILASFFGHGSNVLTEIDFGRAEEYNNILYPLMLINGCDAGNPNIDTNTLATFVTKANGGAIAAIGTSDVGFSGYLSVFTQALLKSLFTDTNSITLGEAMQRAIVNFYDAKDPLNIIHAQQYFLMGDPGLELFHPIYPKYEANVQALVVNRNAIQLSLNLFNKGAFRNDSVLCIIEFVALNGKLIAKDSVRIKSFPFQDSIQVSLPMLSSHSELAQLNLSIQSKRFNLETKEFKLKQEVVLKKTSVRLIYPYSNQIIQPNSVFVFQHSNVEDRIFTMLLDTSKNINSPYRKTFQFTQDKDHSTLAVNELMESKYYVRLISEENDTQTYSFYVSTDTIWNFKSEVEKDIDSYFSQGIVASPPFLDYSPKITTIRLLSSGTMGKETPQLRINNLLAVYGLFTSTELVFAAYNYPSLERINSFSAYELPANTPDFMGNANGKSGVLKFSMDQVSQDSLLKYLNGLPSGHYLFCIAGNQFNANSLSEALKNKFQAMDWHELLNLPLGKSFLGAFNAQSGEGASSSGVGDIGLNIDMVGKQQKGLLRSSPITFIETIQQVQSSGITSLDDVSSINLVTNSNRSLDFGLNTTFIPSMLTFPYSIEYTLENNNNGNIAKQLQVLVQGKVMNDYSISCNKPIIRSFVGTTIVDTLGLTKLSSIDRQDSLSVVCEILRAGETMQKDTFQIDENSEEIAIQYASNLPEGTYTVLYKLFGTDANSSNNTISKVLKYVKDDVQPEVQVYVDGRLYFNKDIISKNTAFKFSIQKPYAFAIDTIHSTIELMDLQYQNKENISLRYERIDATHTHINFNLNPSLKDGSYQIVFDIKDDKGNRTNNKNNPLEFELVNKTMLSNVFPYPNPFSDKAFFVFTATGALPDVFFIDFYNLRGVKVKRIDLKSDPQLKIGHNQSSIFWDGKDEFGNKLGRGVYFYKVIAKSKGMDIPIYNTNTNQFFKHNTGKIYLIN